MISIIESILKNPNYNNEDLSDHNAAAGIIRNNQGELLMMDHNKFNFWTIPIGKCQPGQSAIDGLKQEMFEELNIKVINAKLVGTFKTPYERNGVTVNVKSHIFEITKYTGTIRNNEPHKHKAIEWLSLDKINTLDLSDNAKWVVNNQNKWL